MSDAILLCERLHDAKKSFHVISWDLVQASSLLSKLQEYKDE